MNHSESLFLLRLSSLQSRRDDMFIEKYVPPPLFSPVGTICLFFYAVPTELKRGRITFNYKHIVPTGLERVSDIENSLSLHL